VILPVRCQQDNDRVAADEVGLQQWLLARPQQDVMRPLLAAAAY
jgi:hypothetical protein